MAAVDALQVVELVHEAEGAGRRDFAREGLAGQRHAVELLADRLGVGIVEFVGIFRRVGRAEPDVRILDPDLDRTRDLDRGLLPRLLVDAGPIEQRQIAQRVAVQDRRLAAVQRDQHVVDPRAGDGGHQVLDDPDLHPVPGEHGAQIGLGYEIIAGRNLGIVQVGPAKDDAAARRCRRQGHVDQGAAVQSDAVRRDLPRQRDACAHGRIIGGGGRHGNAPIPRTSWSMNN